MCGGAADTHAGKVGNACVPAAHTLRILNARMRDYLASLEQTEESEPQTA